MSDQSLVYHSVVNISTDEVQETEESIHEHATQGYTETCKCRCYHNAALTMLSNMPQALYLTLHLCRIHHFTVGPGSGPSSSLMFSQYSCAPRASRPFLSCAKYSALIDLRSIYVRPVRGCNGAGCRVTGCATGWGGAGHALMMSASKLLLFLVSPLFSLKGLLRSIGLSFPAPIPPLGTWRPAAVMSAEILGSWSCQGL